MHLCTRHVDAAISLRTQGKADARMASRAYDVADAGIPLDARKEADARILPRAYDVATRASLSLRRRGHLCGYVSMRASS